MTTIYLRSHDPAPEGFPARFIRDGWRGVERYYGARTSINVRWLDECGRERLKQLRLRYRRGDLSALEEVANAPRPA